jgi:hypothetical protein
LRIEHDPEKWLLALGKDHAQTTSYREQGDPVMTSAMTRAELTEKLLGIKRENGWSWKHICAEVVGMSPVLVTDGAGIL